MVAMILEIELCYAMIHLDARKVIEMVTNQDVKTVVVDLDRMMATTIREADKTITNIRRLVLEVIGCRIVKCLLTGPPSSHLSKIKLETSILIMAD